MRPCVQCAHAVVLSEQSQLNTSNLDGSSLHRGRERQTGICDL